MHDWTGSRIREDAMSVPCLYCAAPAGRPCVAKTDGKPLQAFPAHTSRITEARRAAQERGNGGAA